MEIWNFRKTFWQLLKTDLYIFGKNNLISSLVNSTIWIGGCTVAAAYIYPTLGMTKDYGPFWIIGGIVSVMFFEMFGNIAHIIHHTDTFMYNVSLPLPSLLLHLKGVTKFALQALVYPIFLLPLTKLLFWDKVTLAQLSLFKYGLIALSAAILTGSFSLLLSSTLSNFLQIRNLFGRVLFPLWIFGASQFSWHTLLKVFPIIAYINLANPYVYAMEGIRVAVLGQPGYINFWLCILALWVFNILFTFIGYKKLKKKLDFI